MKKHFEQMQQHERTMEIETIQKNRVSPKKLNRRRSGNFLIGAMLLFAFCGFTNQAMGQTFSGGSGTENVPYLISSKADMEALAEAVNNGNNYSQGKFFLLTKDITEEVTTAIGGYTIPFQGTFDGGEHIVNINLNQEVYGGFFGNAAGATIKNLKVKGNISTTVTYGNYSSISGGICGFAYYNTSIINCYNMGIISSSNSYAHSGGICGYMTDGKIINCSNNGSIASLNSDSYSGGICGYANNSTIMNCSNTGDISSSTRPHSGGICGYAEANTSITNCSNTGNVNSNSSPNDTNSYSGGICGFISDGNIMNCFNTGIISSSSNFASTWNSFYSCSGGICGENHNTTITNSSNLGDINAQTGLSTIPSDAPFAYSGGICGIVFGGSINSCSNKGNISSGGTGSSYFTAYYSNVISGGICASTDSYTKIINCIAANTTITATEYGYSTYFDNSHTGRIVGYGNGVSNCYALASMLLGDTRISSQDANSHNGKDIDSDDLGNVFINMDFSTCSQAVTTIMLNTTNTIKWQRSADNEQSWTDITCTTPYYIETDIATGQYIYRALNGDGTYSNYVRGVYSDAIPSTINTLPLTNTSKRVDENVTFNLELTDNNYNYQWYKGDDAIYGATNNTYSIPVLKMSDAGIYHCQVWNGCNEIASSNTMLIMDKGTQTITLPETTLTKAYGDADFDLLAVTDKNQTIAYSSSNTGVATVSGNQVHIVGLGSTTITASQAGNSEYIAASPVTLSLTVNKGQQSITFDVLPDKTYGDPDFSLSASVNSNRTIAYESSNTNVATVSGNTLTIHGAGSVIITAFVAGDDYYDASSPVQRQLIVNKATLSATADNKNRLYGDNNPIFTITYSGFKNSDNQSSLSQVPTASCEAALTSAVGSYPIVLSIGNSQNYSFVYQNGTLAITKTSLTIYANNATRPQGQPNPVFTLSYSGFKNNEDYSALDELPVATCAADENSVQGYYTIFLSGGYDNNYSYALVNGALEVTVPMGIEYIATDKISVYPNPVKSDLFIKSDLPIKKVEIHSLTGTLLKLEDNFNEKISVSSLLNGVYLIIIYTDKGVFISKIAKE